MESIVIHPALILLAAALSSNVGPAGASGDLAAMAPVGLAPDVMKPSALVLNVLVATIATARFARAGCFSWPRSWPFASGSVPTAFVGGAVTLPGHWYEAAVGIVLMSAAYRLWWGAGATQHAPASPTVPVVAALVAGAGIGLLSGLTGTGGGIVLGPLWLFTGWAETRESAGVSAAFILVNRVAGLAGLMTGLAALPRLILLRALAAIVGGVVGSGLGSRRPVARARRASSPRAPRASSGRRP